MITHFFKTNTNCAGYACQVKRYLDKLKQKKEIERWNVNLNSPDHVLEIVTNKMSPERAKHYIRATGFEAEFTKAPQA